MLDRAHRLWPPFLSESYGLFRCLASRATYSGTSHSLWRASFLHNSVILLDHTIQVLALAPANATRQRALSLMPIGCLELPPGRTQHSVVSMVTPDWRVSTLRQRWLHQGRTLVCSYPLIRKYRKPFLTIFVKLSGLASIEEDVIRLEQVMAAYHPFPANLLWKL